ncbi:MAG TPA: hypothetical protein VHZ09_08190 [Acidobacteriaceae bacterium]|jgi:hypothetical protein|nr:hypothetical protein [Acidobacteriaceae bacterium]
MNWGSWLLWGFVATLVLTILSAGAQSAGLTRISFPQILGTMFTADRDKAKLFGVVAHIFLGLVYSLIYVLIFQALGSAGWWRGAIIGLIHGFFVLLVVMKLLPGLHPRMASEQYGPTAHRLLEPPGLMALHYGLQTPVAIILSHIAYGVVLGAFYRIR